MGHHKRFHLLLEGWRNPEEGSAFGCTEPLVQVCDVSIRMEGVTCDVQVREVANGVGTVNDGHT
jgi:hypothetical protein